MGTKKVAATKKLVGPVMGVQLSTGPLLGPYPANTQVADLVLPGAGEFEVRLFSDLATFDEAQSQSGPWFLVRKVDGSYEGCYYSKSEAQRHADEAGTVEQRVEQRYTHRELQGALQFRVYAYQTPDDGLSREHFASKEAAEMHSRLMYPVTPCVESFKSVKLFVAAWNEQEAKRPKTVADLVQWLQKSAQTFDFFYPQGSALLLPDARLAKFFGWKKMTDRQRVDKIDGLAAELQKSGILVVGHDSGLLVFPFPVRAFDQDIGLKLQIR